MFFVEHPLHKEAQERPPSRGPVLVVRTGRGKPPGVAAGQSFLTKRREVIVQRGQPRTGLRGVPGAGPETGDVCVISDGLAETGYPCFGPRLGGEQTVEQRQFGGRLRHGNSLARAWRNGASAHRDDKVPAESTCPSPHPRLGRLAVCDHVHRGTVRYVMVSLVVAAYTDIIDCG